MFTFNFALAINKTLINFYLVFIWIILVFTLILVEGKPIEQNIVTVRTKSGLINGKVETPVDGKQLNIFRGIPFAKPPVGELRFRRPVPVDGWNDTVKAYQCQSACPHDLNRFDVKDFLLNKNVSEDCLYLNVWSPKGNGSNNVLKPVMFWIHGGGLLMGSTSEEYYQADILAAKGDIVVVSTSYRLNIFGFLYSGTDEAPGNVGLLDQALALQWVKDNIESFGGDPNQITISGESAGSWSTSLHILSPVTRHLFKNAILNSGAYVTKFSEDRPKDHIKRWLKGAAMIGCSDESNPGKFTQKVMKCLRAVEYSKLVPITDFGEIIPGSVKVFDVVVTDGYFLPEHPNEMLRKGDFKHDINMIVSTVEDEGDFLISNFNDTKRFHPIHPENLTYTEAYNHLREMSSNMNCEQPINGEDVAQIYFKGMSDSNSFDELRKTIGIATGDYYLTCPTLLFAKEVFKNSNFKSNVYQYYYNSKFQSDFFCSKWMGVCHFIDVYPMFGIPFLKPSQFNDRERQISEQMIEFLSNFVKTGKPSPQQGAPWPKYYTIDDQIISPYYEIENEVKNTPNFKIGRKINECEYLWKKYIL